MENLWQSKCGFMWPLYCMSLILRPSSLFATATRINAAKPWNNSRTHGTSYICLVSTARVGHAYPEASFLSLLPGPSAQQPRDLQHLYIISCQVSTNHRTTNYFSAAGSRVSLLPSALTLPQNMDCHDVKFSYGRRRHCSSLAEDLLSQIWDASFRFIPDSDTENLQAGEKFLTCARTEGYKSRSKTRRNFAQSSARIKWR